jgi:hypothetical protein
VLRFTYHWGFRVTGPVVMGLHLEAGAAKLATHPQLKCHLMLCFRFSVGSVLRGSYLMTVEVSVRSGGSVFGAKMIFAA